MEQPQEVSTLAELVNSNEACMDWNRRQSNFFIKRIFKQGDADPCLFVRHRDSNWFLLALHVDDGIISATHEQEFQQFKEELQSEFKVTAKLVMGSHIRFCGNLQILEQSVFICDLPANELQPLTVDFCRNLCNMHIPNSLFMWVSICHIKLTHLLRSLELKLTNSQMDQLKVARQPTQGTLTMQYPGCQSWESIYWRQCWDRKFISVQISGWCTHVSHEGNSTRYGICRWSGVKGFQEFYI